MSLTVESARQAFLAASEAAARAARFAPGAAPPWTCRFCGRHWAFWNLSNGKSEGHAVCLVTEEFRVAVRDLWFASPALNMDRLARAIGVTPRIVNAWVYGKATRAA